MSIREPGREPGDQAVEAPGGATTPAEPRERRHARATGRVRIEDVARLAAVSPQTVSRFFRAPALVAAATGERIREAVQASGYVPNLIAGSLASNRSRVVAILVPTIANPVHAAPVEGLSDVLGEAGYQVLLGCTGYDRTKETGLIQAFLGRRVDGLVITGGSLGPETGDLLRALGLPVVQIWELPDDPIDMAVGFSNHAAGAAVAEHLAARGYRWPVVLAHAAASDTRSAARVEGFLDASARLGRRRPSVLAIDSPTSLGSGEAALERVLLVEPEADAVFAVSDQVAVGIVLACQRRGLAVPGRLAVVGFGDVDIAARLVPALTTVRVHRYRLGEQAGHMLLARLEGQAVERRVVDIGFELILRESS